jgi:peroxiredoxin
MSPARGEEKQKRLSPAPDFSLKDLHGRRIALKDLLGQGPILIDFWATWCKPCLKELTHTHDLYLKYKDRGFLVVAISEDSPRSLSKVKSFVAGNRYQFLVLLDENNTLMRKLNFQSLPHTILLDPQGHVMYSHNGYRPGDEKVLEKKLLSLFEQQEALEETSEQPVETEQVDEGDNGKAETPEEERSQRKYIKKVKGEKAKKIQAEERDG